MSVDTGLFELVTMGTTEGGVNSADVDIKASAAVYVVGGVGCETDGRMSVERSASVGCNYVVIM